VWSVLLAGAEELRAVWIATVYNIDFPKTNTASKQRQEMVDLVKQIADFNLNAIFFQVRTEGDALYNSKLEPWSRFLTKTSGRAPQDGFDPLKVLIEEAKKYKIAVHAWMNPYRAKAGSTAVEFAPNHISNRFPDYVYPYNKDLWSDPGYEGLQDHLVNTIEDLLDNYELRGIHFDDYFYPYPVPGVDFPDGKTFTAYTAAGGTLSKADWRRDNVNRMVERVSKLAHARGLVFSISPFGIYRPGVPEGIKGLDQYGTLYADPLLWIKNKWIDHYIPQLYWSFKAVGQDFRKLLDWWAGLSNKCSYLAVGLDGSKFGQDGYTAEDFKTQFSLIRDKMQSSFTAGIFWFSWKKMMDSAETQAMLRELWPSKDLFPVEPQCVSFLGGVDNDAFEKAIAVTSLPYSSSSLSNELASTQKGEPVFTNIGSLWWLFQASSDETLTVSTKGSTTGTKLGIYTGSSLDTLKSLVQNQACGSESFSCIDFQPSPGTRYYIVVGSNSLSNSGNITLSISLKSSKSEPSATTSSPSRTGPGDSKENKLKKILGIVLISVGGAVIVAAVLALAVRRRRRHQASLLTGTESKYAGSYKY